MRDTIDGINEGAWEKAMASTPRHNVPSVRTLMQIKDVTEIEAQAIRAIMRESPGRIDGQTRMQRIDRILRTFGVEYVPIGAGANSPPFYYCNAGDSYAVTVIKRKGRFIVSSWGDLVERGRYA